MKKNKHTLYSRRIANYLYKDMTLAERQAFEDDLLVDQEFADEYEFQSEAVEYLKSKTSLEELRSSPDLAEAERIADEIFGYTSGNMSDNPVSQSSPKKGMKRLTRYSLLAAAAAAAVLLLISDLFLINQNDRMFRSYYKPLDVANYTLRGDHSAEREDLSQALGLYQNGAYIEASNVLAAMNAANPESPEFTLFLGLSKMGEEDYQQAEEILESYLNSFNKYLPEAQWYLSLCYLRTDQEAEAESLLVELTGEPGILGRNSMQLLKKLQ